MVDPSLQPTSKSSLLLYALQLMDISGLAIAILIVLEIVLEIVIVLAFFL